MRWGEKKHPKRGGRWLVDKYFRQVGSKKWHAGLLCRQLTDVATHNAFLARHYMLPLGQQSASQLWVASSVGSLLWQRSECSSTPQQV